MGAIIASTVTYIPPIVALLIGGVLMNEPIVFSDYFATILIFIGMILINKKPQAKKQGAINIESDQVEAN